MADTFYGINPGETLVTVAASTTGKKIELRVEDAASITKKDIYLAAGQIADTVLEDKTRDNI